MKFKLLVAIAVTLGLFAGNASATKVYHVADSVTNCGSSPHGLWTNNLIPTTSHACSNYFSIGKGQLTEYDDDTAHFNATASNGKTTAIIDLFLSHGTDDAPNPLTNDAVKRGGFSGSGYDIDEQNTIINNEWRFYGGLTGKITVGHDVYDVVLRQGTPDYQQGRYANDKTADYGASVWLKAIKKNGEHYYGSHWDINVDLKPVPLPAAVWLFGSAIVGLVGIGRRRKMAAA